jgi:hypothetical protein
VFARADFRENCMPTFCEHDKWGRMDGDPDNPCSAFATLRVNLRAHSHKAMRNPSSPAVSTRGA